MNHFSRLFLNCFDLNYYTCRNVYINGEYIGKLNDYVINETQDYNPRTVSIPFDSAILLPFDNTIEITSGANSEGTNYDDFEFYNLKMVIYWDQQMPIAIPEPIPEPYFQ